MPICSVRACRRGDRRREHVRGLKDGFTALHAACEVDNAAAVPWLATNGLGVEATTKHGHTPLHIAAALGHAATARALLDAGADPQANSPTGTPLEVARAQGKDETVALLGSL
ncbi:MAG: ankyrin repeat domain-containing protein [Myxococcota bacterium]